MQIKKDQVNAFYNKEGVLIRVHFQDTKTGRLVPYSVEEITNLGEDEQSWNKVLGNESNVPLLDNKEE